MEKKFVEVFTYTWAKDSHGLFDYESPHLSTHSFKITSSAHFFRKNNEIHSLDTPMQLSNLPIHQAPGFLFTINQDPTNSNRYFIYSPSQTIDLVVRAIRKDGQPAGYDLKVGDIIKIGRVKFWVREFRDANGVLTKIKTIHEVKYLPNTGGEEEEVKHDDKGEKLASEVNCRICLMKHLYPDPLDNTLVSPCKCKGSCEYVHLKCLKQWIDSKKSSIENTENICLSFNYKKLSCEICKESLPYALKLGLQEYDIIDIKKPANVPYIILEKIESGRENKGLFLVKASEQEGRGHTHQILVSDISVSRNHASIIYKDGRFLLFDNNSKFGTLIQIDQPIELSSEKTILQCGKTVVMISLKKEESVVVSKNLGVPPEQVVDSPRTPSTTNEQDADCKQQKSESTREKRVKKRLTEVENRGYDLTTTMEETKQNDGLQELELLTENSRTSNLLPNSKKIFKIIKAPRVKEIDGLKGMGKKKVGRRGNQTPI